MNGLQNCTLHNIRHVLPCANFVCSQNRIPLRRGSDFLDIVDAQRRGWLSCRAFQKAGYNRNTGTLSIFLSVTSVCDEGYIEAVKSPQFLICCEVLWFRLIICFYILCSDLKSIQGRCKIITMLYIRHFFVTLSAWCWLFIQQPKHVVVNLYNI
jgi:hypothetical protein